MCQRQLSKPIIIGQQHWSTYGGRQSLSRDFRVGCVKVVVEVDFQSVTTIIINGDRRPTNGLIGNIGRNEC